LKKGEPVVFELVAEDVVTGFNLADFGVRSDVLPGKVMRVRFVPDRELGPGCVAAASRAAH
jgi:cytochrome c oxidase subunit 2